MPPRVIFRYNDAAPSRRRNPARKPKPPTLAEAGLPEVWFHGTQKTFGKLKAQGGACIWLADKAGAMAYATPHYGRRSAIRLIEITLAPDTRIADLADASDPIVREFIRLDASESNMRWHGREDVTDAEMTAAVADWNRRKTHYDAIESRAWSKGYFRKAGADALLVRDVKGWGGHEEMPSLCLLNAKKVVGERDVAPDLSLVRAEDMPKYANPRRRTASRRPAAPSRHRNPPACPVKMMKYEYLGTTDEVTTCDCCGKTGLKNTVAIRDLDEGEVMYFGVTCAARALKVQVADVKKGAADADRKRREEEFRRRDAENRANTALWHEWLIERTGGIYEYDRSPDVLRMIQALGGMAAARVGFEDWKAAKKARSNPRRRIAAPSRRRNPSDIDPRLLAADGARYFSDEALAEADNEAAPSKSRTALVLMHPKDFLKMVEPGKREESQVALERVLDAGTRLSDVPRLFIAVDSKNPRIAHVTGHEGRHRSRALLARGVTKMPVRLHAQTIRWGEQANPKSWDYLPELPNALLGEGSHRENVIDMPAPLHHPEIAPRLRRAPLHERLQSLRSNPEYPCARCGGSGKLSGYSHVWGGVCFKCGGTGTQSTKPSAKPIKWAVHFPKTVERPTAIDRGDDFVYVVSAKNPDQAVLKATTTFLGSRLRHEFTDRGAWAEPYEEYYARWEAERDAE